MRKVIFVTVGTHEQQFDRLIKKIDCLKEKGYIKEQVFIQTGFSTYQPQYCLWSNLISYEEMIQFVKKAEIVITHGGPASFLLPLQMGKIPIVVPRQKQYGEHVNDHQVEFCRAVENRKKNIIVVEDINKLENVIPNYQELLKKYNNKNDNHNEAFNKKFENIVKELLK